MLATVSTISVELLFSFNCCVDFLFGVSLGFSSCKKCQTCTYGTYSEDICQDDFDTKDEYKSYISLIEAFGGDCK